MNTGLMVSITAMLTAFAVLSGIALVVYLLRLFSIPRRAPASLPAAPEPASLAEAGSLAQVRPEAGDAGMSPRVIAAITAALSVYLDRPVTWTPGVKPGVASTSWVALGRQAQLQSRRVGSR
jgi:hypothetical protein